MVGTRVSFYALIVAVGTLGAFGLGLFGTWHDGARASVASAVPLAGDNDISCVDTEEAQRLFVSVGFVRESKGSLRISFNAFTNSSDGDVFAEVMTDRSASVREINRLLVAEAKRVLTQTCGSTFGSRVEIVMFGRATGR